MSVKIFGGGMAGLLAAHVLRKHKPVIHEAQPSLPHNHEALLRFRDNGVSELTGIPFKKVKVLKGICYQWEIITSPNLRMANLYSRKTNGTVRSRSILDLSPSERYIAPKDFVERLSKGVEVVYNSPLNRELLEAMLPDPHKDLSVSTIPMPAMMKMIGWPEMPEFNFKSIWAVTVEITSPEVDVYQTLYYPGDEPYYRCSVTGSKLIMEFQKGLEDWGSDEAYRAAYQVLEDFGISNAQVSNLQVKEQRFGKLVPIDDTARRGFIMALSEIYGVYSLGRFATWKPNLLMHEIPQDADLIARMINSKDAYARNLELMRNSHRL